ncbi:MAG: response regulator [Hyphomicrobiaceae bacterium]
MSRILVVDDEEAVRTRIELILRRDGHHVEVAANGQAGVDAVSDTPFDLAFVDLLMPGKDGMRTIAEMRRIAPLLPIVAMSGMSSAHEPAGEAPAAMHRPATPSAIHWLHKPFKPDRLRQVVQAALGIDDPGQQAVAS